MRELTENAQLGMYPVALLDDDPSKAWTASPQCAGGRIGVRAATRRQRGGRDRRRDRDAVASGRAIREVVRVGAHGGSRDAHRAGLFEILSGEKRVSALRQIEIQDLLRREPIKTDLAQVASLVRDRVVLVTGRRRLDRQRALPPARAARAAPAHRARPRRELDLRAPPGAAAQLSRHRDRSRHRRRARSTRASRRVFELYRPYAVFHAAAHKHVPLMEANVDRGDHQQRARHAERRRRCARRTACEHFVLISTDKAVRPTSVMGATKRIAEQHRAATRASEQRAELRRRCGSATCSAAGAAWCRRSCGRSRRAAR